MGAWGAGSFENDVALDFAADISSAEDLLGPLTVDSPDKEIDADQACKIIVVAECVAAMRGHPSGDLPPELGRVIAGFGRPGKSLFHHSCDHLCAVLERSELKELWNEDDPSEFIESVHELIGRLNREPGTATKPASKSHHPDAVCAFCNELLGDEETASINVTYEGDTYSSVGFMTSIHIACLNRALHVKFRNRPFRIWPEDMPEGEDGLFELLESKPTLDE